MSTRLGIRATVLFWRSFVARAAAVMLLTTNVLMGLTVGTAHAASDDTTKEIAGASMPSNFFAVGGIGLLVVGAGLLLVRRKLSDD